MRNKQGPLIFPLRKVVKKMVNNLSAKNSRQSSRDVFSQTTKYTSSIDIHVYEQIQSRLGGERLMKTT